MPGKPHYMFPVVVSGWGGAEASLRVAVPGGDLAQSRQESLARAVLRRKAELTVILQELVDEVIDEVPQVSQSCDLPPYQGERAREWAARKEASGARVGGAVRDSKG